jgi:N-acetylmuramoyl-L-alanine amidase
MLLQLGDKGDNVKYLQYGLHILCCSPNGFDGEFGNGTLTAVKKFQSKYGLVSDGIVGDVTWNTLKNEIATIQAQLNKKGCSVGTVDGIAGPATYNAVISFQNKNGLTADGQVGTATWDILFDTVSGGTTYTRILKVTSPLMQGDDVKAVQNKLNSLGFNCGTADGYYGNDTKNAVISFQSSKGIDTDGIVGPTTWKLLFNSSSNGSDYSRILKVTSPLMYGDDIKAVQNKLNSLGFNCGTADGYYGNDTKNAVISFQSSKGLTADGEVGPATWNALFNSSSSSSGGTLPGGSIKVFIDAGHGGTDPGAVGNGLNEKDVVLNIAKKLGALLNGRGISIKYSRTTDTYVSLEERARLANAWGADLFVSIHANSATSSVRGTECYTHPTANTATKTLSGNVSRAIASKFGISNRGHKEANFAVLRLSNMPAILVETAFISNSSDANLLNTRQDDFANAIFNEILNYFNMSISTSTILDQINNSGFAELFGVKFTQTLQEKIIAQAGPIKVKLSLTRGGSNNGEIVANFKNGSFDSGTFKNDLLDLSTTLSKNGVNISKQLLKLGNKSFSISVSTNNNIITVSLTKTLNINDSTFSQVLSIEYDKDGLKDIYENITVVVNSLVEKSKPILLPLLLIGALIIFIKLGFLSALISFGAALLTQLGYAIYTMITFIATN